MRITHWTTLSSPQLWQAWLAQYPSIPQAEAAAIWAANRLIKQSTRGQRRTFYPMKDVFLTRAQSYLVEGYTSRVERDLCHYCDQHYGGCSHCGGTGIWRERTLWLHTLNIEGVRYSFHSYVKPVHVCGIPGEDKVSYGSEFTDAQWSALGLPLSGLLQMLRYVHKALWYDQQRLTPVPTLAMPFTCHCKPWLSRLPGQHHHLCRKKES